ncbi:Serine/arginine repetitive matrix protein 1 [Coemansia sp. Benny D115]|nr:Serine/arginine repetitive matrix protein 1 [Coemansia sp. Benny D115]
MVGGFFRGTNIEQDQRFGDASKKLRDQMSFSSVLKKRVDLGKVNMEVIKPWISNEIINILGIEDEVLFEYIVNMLDESNTPDPKTMQVNLTGFLEGKTQGFMQSLWEVLLEAQESPTGIPESFIRNKVEELRVKKEEQEKIRANVQAAENRMKNGETRNAPAAAAAAEGGSSESQQEPQQEPQQGQRSHKQQRSYKEQRPQQK